MISAIGNGINESTDNNALVLANSVANHGGIIFQTNNDTGYSVASKGCITLLVMLVSEPPILTML